jgi:hypothetical protein
MKFLADENFDNTIIRGLLRRKPDVDLLQFSEQSGQTGYMGNVTNLLALVS